MNKEVRRKDRIITDINEIIQIIDKAKILHLGLVDNGFPYILPLHYGYEYDREGDKIVFYMHGANAGHKIDLINSNSNAGVELETDIELDPAGDKPCEYSSFYSSVIGMGNVSVVDNKKEKERALYLLMLNQTGRSFEFTEQMVASVTVIKLEVTEYTAKARKKML